MRLPITIRSRGNWSVLYVRMVCVTTLPKCLVHMVSSLKDNKSADRHLFLFEMKQFFIYSLKKCHEAKCNLYKKWDVYSSPTAAAKTHKRHKYTQFMALRIMLLFLIPSEWHAISIAATDKLVFPTRHPRIDRAGEDFLFHYKDRTF